MNINARLRALEVAQAERQKVEVLDENAEAIKRIQDTQHEMHEAMVNLAIFMAGPATVGKRLDFAEMPKFIELEILRCAWLCGQRWLRADADAWRMLVQFEDRVDVEKASGHTAEQIEAQCQLRIERAQKLDDAGVPDMSREWWQIPLVAGGTWQQKLAWVLAVGDLDAELKRVKIYDHWPSENARYKRNFPSVPFYVSPLETVPPLPGWLTDGLIENPHLCVPYQWGTKEVLTECA